MIALLVFMGFDYITGIIVRHCGQEAVQRRRIQGHLSKRCSFLMLVGVANILDVHVVAPAAHCAARWFFFYLSNEGLSLLENAAHIGLPGSGQAQGHLDSTPQPER
jgi:phage-related holin